MSIREDFERREETFLSHYACLSSQTRGRKEPESPCAIRTAFQVDKDRIVYSNAFRRMKYKTQVFLSPMGDVYRTRLTHTLEVSQIARAIARAMRFNEDLVEAIALGHDLGHPPFGHSGEMALKEIDSNRFSHSKQGLRVVDFLEKNGKGLNLTFEVRDGILKHSKGYGEIMPDDPGKLAITVEGKIVRIADIMAYLNHDLDDAIRSKVIGENQVPAFCVKVIGKSHSERAANMIKDLISCSGSHNGKFRLKISSEMHEAMMQLRQFLFDNVYRSYSVHKEFLKSKKILSELYHHMIENEEFFKKQLIDMEMIDCYHNGQPKSRLVCDFIASMTDRYALRLYEKIFFPSPQV
jgi:dGTPase